MPRYDVVAHLTIDLDATSPGHAAAVFKQCLRAGVDPGTRVRGLALWRPHDGRAATPLPAPLPEQLQDFFDGVAWRAAQAEAAFRVEVEGIIADVGGRHAADDEDGGR